MSERTRARIEGIDSRVYARIFSLSQSHPQPTEMLLAGSGAVWISTGLTAGLDCGHGKQEEARTSRKTQANKENDPRGREPSRCADRQGSNREELIV